VSAPRNRPRYRPRPGSIPTLGVPSLEGVRSVHLIGIGGAGMRNLARLLLARGVAVSGSDLKDSEGLRELSDAGAHVRIGHDAAALGHPDAVVISTAIDEGNPELAAARAAGVAVWARQQAVAALAAPHRAIAVAGTTGKTTTTSMIATILDRAGLDPSYLIGGDLNESGSGAKAGDGDVFLFEADESDGSFLLTDPAIGVVTNVEVDHVDFYPGGEDELRRAFAEFCARSGQVVACVDDPGAREAVHLARVSAIRYGTGSDADLRLTVDSPGPGGARGTLSVDGAEIPLSLQIDGAHNLVDAAAAVAVGELVGVPPPDAARALASFAGVHRRFEERGSVRGARFFDDYAHVPTELAVTLEVARARRPSRVVAVFQPHRYSRTQALWRQLGAALTGADLVVVTDVYGANQTPIPGVTGALVVDGVRSAAPDQPVVYAPHREDAVAFLTDEVRDGDLVITLGCGDVWTVADAALARIREVDGA
jgi:UDP-N-acetylmuramate--alanine ligase